MDYNTKVGILIKNISINASLENLGGRTDFSKGLETLTKTIFEVVDKTTFQTSAIKCNYETIEFESDNGVQYQVTTNSNFKKKCDYTLKNFKDKNSSKKLKIVYYKILNKNELSYKEKLMTENNFLEIVDSADLVRLICNCSTSDISNIYLSCQEFCPIKYEDFDFNICLKKAKLCENFIKRTLYWEEHNDIPCEELLNIGNSVIAGDASTGKTELLNYINNISVERNRCTFLYKLKNYSGQDLENILPNALFYSLEPLLLLDGFDELGKNYTNEFVKILNTFATKHPDFQIIISTRKNFCSKDSQIFNDYNFVYIKEIDDLEIKSYFNNKLGILADEKLNICRELNVYNLLRTPFYLTRICSVINSNSNITNRSKLMEVLFDEDYKKFKHSELIDQKTLLNKLMDFAEYLIINDKSYVSVSKYSCLNSDIFKDFPWLLYQDNNISFVHNNFKEYLMALKMSTFALNKIKKLISVKIDKIYIKPQFSNILSFLLSINNNNKLHNYILKYGKYIVVDLENTSLTDKEKYYIVKKIYNEYETKKSWPDAVFFKSTELSKICNTKEIVEFLISNINLSKHRTIIVYTLEVLKDIKCWFGFKENLENIVFSMLNGEIEDYVVLSNLIYFWVQLSPDINNVCKIYMKYKNHEKSSVRASVNYLLKEFKLGNKFINDILQGITYSVPKLYNIDEVSNDVIDIGENLYLGQAIDQIDDKQAILKILDYLIENEKKFNAHYMGEHMFNALNNIEEPDDEIINKVYELFELVKSYSTNNFQNLLVEWLESHNLKDKIIKNIINSDKIQEYLKYDMLYSLYSEEYIDLIVDAFKNNILHNPKSFIIGLKTKNINWKLLKEELIKNGVECNETDAINYEEERKKNIIKNFNDFFDLGSLVQKIDYTYKEINKETLNRREVIDFYCGVDFYERIPNIMYHLFDKKSEKKEEIISKLSRNWQINAIYDTLIHNKFILPTDTQKEFIKEWVYDELTKFSFENNIKYNGDKWSASCNAIYCEYFIRTLDIKVSKAIYEKMICFPWGIESSDDFSQLEFIKEKIGEVALKKALKIYCNKGYLQGFPLENRIKYCIAKHYDFLIDYIINLLAKINKDSIKSYNYNVFIDYLAEFNNLDLALSYYNKFPNELKLYTLNIFSKNGNKKILQFAKKDMSINDENSYKFIKGMLLFGYKKALKYYIKFVKRNKILYFKTEYPYPCLKAYTNKSDFSLLLKLLALTYKFQDEENNIRRDIIYCFEKVCCNSNILVAKNIIKRINRFIKYSKNKSVNYLHYYIDGIKLKCITLNF